MMREIKHFMKFLECMFLQEQRQEISYIFGKNVGIGASHPTLVVSRTKALVSLRRLILKHHAPDCPLNGSPGLRRF